jgi:hypothetical protein
MIYKSLSTISRMVCDKNQVSKTWIYSEIVVKTVVGSKTYKLSLNPI